MHPIAMPKRGKNRIIMPGMFMFCIIHYPEMRSIGSKKSYSIFLDGTVAAFKPDYDG